jgi:SAM-dependent methyltransferase
MTIFEFVYRFLLPLEHPLYQRVHRLLRDLPGKHLVDIGGRRSNYTIGLKPDVEVYITDIPREAEIQKQLDLGATDAIRQTVLRRRSNVRDYIYDDMTATSLTGHSADVVVAVEVLEHVDEDEKFIANVARVLKPGGHFVMTTPNGDWKPKPYPDHKRHYKAAELEALLNRYFAKVKVEYVVNGGWLFRVGYRSHPLIGMWAYGLGSLLERLGLGGQGPMKKHHLLAVCKR